MRRTGRGRPRPGSLNTIHLYRARAAPWPRDMETKPLGAHSTFYRLNPMHRSHLHRQIDGWRASRLSPFSHHQMARDNIQPRRAAQEPNEDERFETPATLLWTRHPRPSSDRSLSVPASLPLQNAGLRCRRAPDVLKWTIKPAVVGRS